MDPRKTKNVTVTLTRTQAEALRQLANLGVDGATDRIEPPTFSAAQRALERVVVAMGYKPQRIAGRVGFATIDGRGSLS